MKKNETNAVTTHDLVILSVLSEEPRHGYGLWQVLVERDVEDWAAMSKPQVYYSLKKLQKKRLIKSVKAGSRALGQTGPESDVFALTEAGSKALVGGLSEARWATQRPPPPFLTWMAMSSHVDRGVMAGMITARWGFLKEELAREEVTLLAFAGASDPMALAGELMVTLTIRQFRLEMEWLGEVRRRFALA